MKDGRNQDILGAGPLGNKMGQESVLKGLDRHKMSYGDLLFELVSNGSGRFTLHIYSGSDNRFHPMMHRTMQAAINASIEKHLTVAPKQVDYKIEYIDPLQSYCVSIIGVHHIMWHELFSMIAEDISNGFRFGNFTALGRRGK